MKPADLLDVLVSDALAAAPAAARPFIERGMSCPGCAFARFETIQEVAVAYGRDAIELAAALAAAGVVKTSTS